MWPSAPLASHADVGVTVSSGVESTLGGVEGSSGSVEGISSDGVMMAAGCEAMAADLLSPPATTATDARTPALPLHRVERQSGGSWDMDATMGAYRFMLSGSAGIAPCWVQT